MKVQKDNVFLDKFSCSPLYVCICSKWFLNVTIIFSVALWQLVCVFSRCFTISLFGCYEAHCRPVPSLHLFLHNLHYLLSVRVTSSHLVISFLTPSLICPYDACVYVCRITISVSFSFPLHSNLCLTFFFLHLFASGLLFPLSLIPCVCISLP